MLRLRDCLTGDTVIYNSGAVLASGRFSLVNEVNLGIHGNWPAGTVLVDDGRGQLEVDGILIRYDTAKTDKKRLAQNELAFIAMEEIKSQSQHRDSENLVSPVIPAQIAKTLDPTELQQELKRVISMGHLHFIATSPRITMRYDEELLHISRVKRTANNYQRHLAAHSECWQQRTFTGIVPSKLRAKISEDEIHIYENRVFARLLDHLERFLRNLIARVSELDETMREGLELEGSSSLHRVLRHSVCATWGESFKAGEAEQIKLRSENQLNVLEEQLRTILQLKQSDTYRAIPRDANVPLGLKNTNILNNDSHYNQVRKLWELWVKEIAFVSKDYREIFRQGQSNVQSFQFYVGLLILRAHQKMGWSSVKLTEQIWMLKHPSGIEGKLNFRDGIWHLSCQSSGFDKEIVFAPLASAVPENIEPVSGRILCALNFRGNVEGIINCSPEDLFSEESMIVYVQRWWVSLFASEYGEALMNLPKAVIQNWPVLMPKGKQGYFYVHYYEEFNIYSWLDGYNLTKENRNAVLRRYFSAKAMGFCPCCGLQSDKSNLMIRSEKGFKASCEICSASWQIRSNGTDWIFEIGAQDVDIQCGRWKQSVYLAN